jgi:hypothetical protein
LFIFDRGGDMSFSRLGLCLVLMAGIVGAGG